MIDMFEIKERRCTENLYSALELIFEASCD